MSPVAVTSLLRVLQRNCHSNYRFLPLLLSSCCGHNNILSGTDATAILSSTSGTSCNKYAIGRSYYRSYKNYTVKPLKSYQQEENINHRNKGTITSLIYNNCSSRNPSSLCSLRNYRTSSSSITNTKQVCSASVSLLTSRLSGSRLLLPGVVHPTSAASCPSTAASCSLHTSAAMAKSKFEYVRQFETDDMCLPNCWLVVRIDGKSFHKFTDTHHYMKPNDDRGLGLMSRAAQHVMGEFSEIVLAYGQSDEYSFVFHKASKLYNRRASKIMTNLVSLFASAFTLYWPRFFNTQELQYPPSFDARVVLYPSDDNLKDYLSWRQADCHINNLYNTCFWKLVQEKGLSPAGSQEKLKGTLSSDKNEILYTEFNINYNNLPELYRKGTVLIRPRDTESDSAIESPVSVSNSKGPQSQRSKGKNQRPSSVVLHCDIIGKQFWVEHPDILGSKRPT